MQKVTINHGPGEVVRVEVPAPLAKLREITAANVAAGGAIYEVTEHAVISVRSVVTAQHRAECVCGWSGPWSLFAGVVTASGNAHLAEAGKMTPVDPTHYHVRDSLGLATFRSWVSASEYADWCAQYRPRPAVVECDKGACAVLSARWTPDA
jgi:hypothetical protein